MKDVEYNALKRRIERYSKQWRHHLGLDWWKITYTWDRTGEATRAHEAKYGTASESDRTAAWADSKWQYLQSSITFNMPQMVDVKDDELSKMILHEHCHALVNEMRPTDFKTNYADYLEHEERVVSNLTAAFWWTWQGGRGEKAKEIAATKTKRRRT